MLGRWEVLVVGPLWGTHPSSDDYNGTSAPDCPSRNADYARARSDDYQCLLAFSRTFFRSRSDDCRRSDVYCRI